jgi:hypothetical protein
MPYEKLTRHTLTQKQLEANRLNAKKSTGPASPRGRAVSSQNARKFELLPFEKPEFPASLNAQYYAHFIPKGAKERQLVDTMVHSDRLRHYFEALETRTQSGATTRRKRASVVPYALIVAECAYQNARQKLEAIRAKAA